MFISGHARTQTCGSERYIHAHTYIYINGLIYMDMYIYISRIYMYIPAQVI